MLNDQDRLRRRAANPRLVTLYRALTRLRSTVTVMNTGAHPDDEHNGMLAVLRHQDGARIVVACSTRGEGGQNTLGPERGGALGVLRSREMEEAARVLDADIAWLGHGPDDPVHDFGFSKSGTDTLARWGKTRTIERLVRAYRQFRPDIVIPTFLDVPGQHGHHRAMTEAAHTALALAADPAYVTEGLAAWSVAKFYLPAWSGGGSTYDDEVPPPAATTMVTATGLDPATGLSFDRLGEVSRAYHASQNMGVWEAETQLQWPLHLVGGLTETSIFDGLPQTFGAIADVPELTSADTAIGDAIAAFPDGARVFAALVRARNIIRSARQAVPADQLHRLDRKLLEIDAAMALAAGIDIEAGLSAARVAPGQTVELLIEVERGMAQRLTVQPVTGATIVPVDAVDMTGKELLLPIKADDAAPINNAFYPDWHSLGGNGLVWLKIEAVVGGETIGFAIDTEEALQLAPAHRVSIAPEALILALRTPGPRSVAIKSDGAIEQISIAPLAGLDMARTPGGMILTPGPQLAPGRHSLPILVHDVPTHSVTPISYPHIGRTSFVRPLSLDILALDLILPATRVGYIGGGADRVGLWLELMGVDVTVLDAAALQDDLAGFDTIVVGIFAFGTRPDLAAATGRLHDWVRSGGHLLTLYHRPSDGWRPDATPPLPLTIGSPSLRWRVTNPQAPVTLLDPDHPLFNGPNRITHADFDGWDKEQGLYFASAWDAAYQPLLSMSDAGEAPLTGSLLSAKVGGGRHTHTSLVLHHQMDRLVPGAFRLMANLLQAA